MADIEKLSVNISVVDLGQIDLLVDQGFYPSRTDFLRMAIRTQLGIHAEEVRQTITRTTMVLGVVTYGKSALERFKKANERVEIKVVGLVHLHQDITPELALETIESITVFGSFRASPEVKAALHEAGRLNK